MMNELMEWGVKVVEEAESKGIKSEDIRFIPDIKANGDIVITVKSKDELLDESSKVANVEVRGLFNGNKKDNISSKSSSDIMDAMRYSCENTSDHLTPYRRHTQITDELRETYLKKNADYGDSFNASLYEDGLLVSKIRLMDKMLRFSSLIKSDDIQVKDESLEDTLMDMANYAIMTVMWMRDNKTSGEYAGMDMDGDIYYGR